MHRMGEVWLPQTHHFPRLSQFKQLSTGDELVYAIERAKEIVSRLLDGGIKGENILIELKEGKGIDENGNINYSSNIITNYVDTAEEVWDWYSVGQWVDSSKGKKLLTKAEGTLQIVKFINSPHISMYWVVQRGGAARSARRAHNPEVGGSNPPPATIRVVLFSCMSFFAIPSQSFCSSLSSYIMWACVPC